MLRAFRHFVACLLAMTLSGQLLEAQLLVCDETKMAIGSTADDMLAMPMHDVTAHGSTTSVVAQSADGHVPASPTCDLAASCLNASAVPSFQDSHRAPHRPDEDSVTRRVSI